MAKYTFKVYPAGHGRTTYRTMEISGEETLDRLCEFILDSFDFIHEHLYEFCMDNRMYSEDNYEYDPEDGGASTDIEIDKIGLVKGQNFHYIYCLLAAVILMILTACGANQEYEDPADPPGTEISGNEAETEREPEWKTEEPDLGSTGTAEDEEEAVFIERAYETDIIYYSEPSGGLDLRKDVEKTQTDYAVYYFELPIDEKERNACIAATDRMLSCIDAALPDLEIVVLRQESYNGVSISGSRLYLSPQPWNSVDYLAKVLLAGYGEWGNYGLAYGYANYLCKKAGADGGAAYPGGHERGSFVPMSAPELYDLNLLCFNEKFVSPKDVEAAKNNACLFVYDYLTSHSEEEYLGLLTASGTAEGIAQANEALETFYVECGVTCSLTEIRYQYGGAAADYGAACEYARFYIYRDWQDKFWEKCARVSENFLHEDYGEVREFFECNVHQMQQYQELFGFDSYNNDLSVFFKNHKVVSTTSFYDGFKHTVQLESVTSLMHEYIHSAMFGHNEWQPDDWDQSGWEHNWKVEGFARYFSYKYNLYMTEMINENVDYSITWVQEYSDAVGRDIDVQIDSRQVEDLPVYFSGETDPDTSYESGASFIGYLADQYGEQAVIAYVCSDNEYNAEWNKSYDELVREWRKYIKDRYSQYSKKVK